MAKPKRVEKDDLAQDEEDRGPGMLDGLLAPATNVDKAFKWIVLSSASFFVARALGDCAGGFSQSCFTLLMGTVFGIYVMFVIAVIALTLLGKAGD